MNSGLNLSIDLGFHTDYLILPVVPRSFNRRAPLPGAGKPLNSRSASTIIRTNSENFRRGSQPICRRAFETSATDGADFHGGAVVGILDFGYFDHAQHRFAIWITWPITIVN